MNTPPGESAEVAGSSNVTWKIASRVLQSDNKMACRVLGWSMSPFLAYGDIVWLRHAEASDLRYGDIVLFTDDQGRHIVHRYLGKRTVQGREVLVIKGDAVAHYDPPVPPGQVVAKVVMVSKGKWNLGLERWPGRMLNVMMALLSSCPGLLGAARAILAVSNSWRLKVTSAVGNWRLPGTR